MGGMRPATQQEQEQFLEEFFTGENYFGKAAQEILESKYQNVKIVDIDPALPTIDHVRWVVAQAEVPPYFVVGRVSILDSETQVVSVLMTMYGEKVKSKPRPMLGRVELLDDDGRITLERMSTPSYVPVPLAARLFGSWKEGTNQYVFNDPGLLECAWLDAVERKRPKPVILGIPTWEV